MIRPNRSTRPIDLRTPSTRVAVSLTRLALVLGLASASATSAIAQVPVTAHPDQQALLRSPDPKLAANKRLVYDFYREVLKPRNMERASQYLAETYIQHNPNIPTGRQALVDIFSKMPRQPVRPDVDGLVSIVAEGDMVTLAFRMELPDPQNPGQTYTTTLFDMYRIEDGKIAEHWDFGMKPPK